VEFFKKLFVAKRKEQPSDTLVPVFVPALVDVLAAAEKKKGAPLEEDEVLSARDNAICITMSMSRSVKMDEGRGYPDISAENVWAEWCEVCKKM